MTKLSSIQAGLLAAIVQTEGGALKAPEGAKSTVAALIKRGFIISAPRADGPSQLLITAAGQAALGPQAALAGQRVSDEAATPLPAPTSTMPKGKIGALVALLRRAEGATISDMMAATGWQAHSVRGAISGAIKKGLALGVASERADGGRIYRISAGEGA